MAVAYYMNMETISLENARDHAEKMTNSNHVDDNKNFCDIDKLQNNLKNGWIVAVSMCNYLESFLNTILRDCIQYDKEIFMKLSIETKVEIVYFYYKGAVRAVGAIARTNVIIEIDNYINAKK